MKKIYLSLMIVLLAFQFTYAQWTNNSGTGNYYLNSGSASIGTSANPGYKLNISTADQFPFAISGNDNNFVGGDISILRTNTAPGIGRSPGIQFQDNSTGYAAMIQAWQGQLQFFNYYTNGWNEVMRITNSGFVGIGTTNPSSELAIGGNNAVNPNNTGADIPYASFTFQNLSGGNNYYNVGRIASVQENGTNIDAGALAFSTGFGGLNERMRINTSGNLLIGKTSQPLNSSYKLDVAGSVRANTITVNTTGADFVFEPTYHLIPLSTLKTYLDQNHHLPEIASAKEMQTDGLNLGENQTKLLQKVEELTLYLIDKDKELNDAKNTITELSNENKDQLTRLKSLQEQVNKLSELFEKLVKNTEKH